MNKFSVGDFRDVDASDPRALIAYLDAVTTRSTEDKQRMYEAQKLAPGMRVLDIGCGTGDDVRAIAAIVGANGRATGVDSSEAMIAEARRRGVPANTEFIKASATELPFESAAFDACRAERVFQHVANAEAAAAEMRRVLRTGGTAFVQDPDWETLMISSGDVEITRRILHALTEQFENPWAGRNARMLLRRAGFGTVIATPVVSTPTLGAIFEI